MESGDGLGKPPGGPDGAASEPPRGGVRNRLRRARAALARWAQALKRDIAAMLLALADPEVGWPARIVLVVVLAYALSPVDLIPDFIPVIGLLDDLIIVPAGLALAIWLMPPGLIARHRAEAAERLAGAQTTGRLRILGLVLVVAVWAAAAWLVYALLT